MEKSSHSFWEKSMFSHDDHKFKLFLYHLRHWLPMPNDVQDEYFVHSNLFFPLWSIQPVP